MGSLNSDVVPALGGHSAEAIAAMSGDVPATSLHAPGSHVVPGGGHDYAPERCIDMKRDGSGACSARPLTDGVRCVGHQRAYDKANPIETE